MNNFHILLIVLGAIIFILCLIITYFKGVKDGLELFETDEELYCFQCEIEMPVKYKGDNRYCSNCGLRH